MKQPVTTRPPGNRSASTRGRATVVTVRARRLLEEGVDRRGEVAIVVGYRGTGAVRGQRDVDLVPRVRPVRMVAPRLGEEGDARHEREGLREVGELERATQCTVTLLPCTPRWHGRHTRACPEVG